MILVDVYNINILSLTSEIQALLGEQHALSKHKH